ncbi:MAG: hypothetical protein ABI134_20825 [Byssovorax sp.]
MNRLSARPAAFFFCALLGLAACGGDPVDSGAGGGGGAAVPITQDVVAAKGGTVANPDKSVSLAIPAGALTKDTKVTITVSPKEETTATSVYTFGPEGVVLSTPATLVISTAGISVPAKMKAVLGVRIGTGSWADVPGATQGSGTLEAPVSSFGAYSVILVAAPACADECMSQADAVCCTTCGCSAPVKCAPTCGSGTMWDCEVGCCFDYVALKCAP